jgi:hypothetical protein
MVLANDFFRLAHHDVTGQPRLPVAVCGLGLAAALLAELAFSRRLVIRGGSVVVRTGAAPADPLAHAVLNQITADIAQDRTLADVRVRLEGLRRDAYPQVAHRLWLAGAVEPAEPGFRLWGRRPVVWVPTDMNQAAWPWARLSTRLRAGERLDEFDSVLAGLANATGLAAMVAFHNIIARIAFALGREGVLPRAFGRTSAGSGAPKYGSLAQSGLALVVLAGYVFGGWDNPVVQLFYWGGAAGAVGILLLITATAFAVPVFFARNQNTETAWRRRIAPLAALVLLLTLTALALSNLDVLLGVPPGSMLTRAVPLAYAAGAAAGAGWALWLRFRQPSVYAAIGLGAKAATAPPVPAPRIGAHSAAITRKENSVR